MSGLNFIQVVQNFGVRKS